MRPTVRIDALTSDGAVVEANSALAASTPIGESTCLVEVEFTREVRYTRTFRPPSLAASKQGTPRLLFARLQCTLAVASICTAPVQYALAVNGALHLHGWQTHCGGRPAREPDVSRVQMVCQMARVSGNSCVCIGSRTRSAPHCWPPGCKFLQHAAGRVHAVTAPHRADAVTAPHGADSAFEIQLLDTAAVERCRRRWPA